MGKIFIALTISFLISSSVNASETGSLSLYFNQRSFEDPNFKGKNSFNTFPVPELGVLFGLYEFSFGLEPLLGFSYVQKTSRQIPAATGQLSEDKMMYQVFTWSLGARYKPWGPQFFIIIPYPEVLLTYRYNRFRFINQSPIEKKVISGGDFGMMIGGGLLFSFMYDPIRKSELKLEWGVKDFGLTTSLHYLPAGWFDRGMGETKTTGGWDIGTGLLIDW